MLYMSSILKAAGSYIGRGISSVISKSGVGIDGVRKTLGYLHPGGSEGAGIYGERRDQGSTHGELTRLIRRR